MKSINDSADIFPITNTKKLSNRYFSPRSGISIQNGSARLDLNILRPSFQSISDNVPTGHSHEQNAFFSRRLIKRKARIRNIAAGWTGGTWWVSEKYFRFIKPAMGSQP